jgi:hypothetical protein
MQRKKREGSHEYHAPWWDHDPSPTIVLTHIATCNLPTVPSVRCLHFSRKYIIHGLTLKEPHRTQRNHTTQGP